MTGSRIVHVSDLHLEPAGEELYPGLRERVERIRAEIIGLGPDLVVASGDLTNRGTSVPEEFGLAATWLDGLGVPYLAVPGNHDLSPSRTRGLRSPVMERYEDGDFAATGYARVFGASPVTRVTVGDLAVLGFAIREDDPDGVLPALAAALAAEDGPVVVTGHYPLVPVRPWPSEDPFGARGYIDRVAPALLELLVGAPGLIAYLCGHVHLTSTRPLGARALQHTAGGLGPGAAALRVYDWDGTTWRYAAKDVEGPDSFWEGGYEFARRDPDFSSGTPVERDGAWTPRLTPTEER